MLIVWNGRPMESKFALILCRFHVFNFTFRRLASGSDDTKVIIWDPFTHRMLGKISTPHIGNIFSVKVSLILSKVKLKLYFQESARFTYVFILN